MKKWVKRTVAGTTLVATLFAGGMVAREGLKQRDVVQKDFSATTELLGAKTEQQKSFIKRQFLRARKVSKAERKEEVDKMVFDYVMRYGREGVDKRILKRFDDYIKKEFMNQYEYLIRQKKISLKEEDIKQEIEKMYPDETKLMKTKKKK